MARDIIYIEFPDIMMVGGVGKLSNVNCIIIIPFQR